MPDAQREYCAIILSTFIRNTTIDPKIRFLVFLARKITWFLLWNRVPFRKPGQRHHATILEIHDKDFYRNFSRSIEAIKGKRYTPSIVDYAEHSHCIYVGKIAAMYRWKQYDCSNETGMTHCSEKLHDIILQQICIIEWRCSIAMRVQVDRKIEYLFLAFL